MSEIDIRQTVRAARKAADLSVSEVARRAGLSQPHLLRWEAGKRDMSGDKLVRLLAVLGLQVSDGTDHGASPSQDAAPQACIAPGPEDAPAEPLEGAA